MSRHSQIKSSLLQFCKIKPNLERINNNDVIKMRLMAKNKSKVKKKNEKKNVSPSNFGSLCLNINQIQNKHWTYLYSGIYIVVAKANFSFLIFLCFSFYFFSNSLNAFFSQFVVFIALLRAKSSWREKNESKWVLKQDKLLFR